MMDYMKNEALWLRKFVEAWHIATENGYAAGELKYLRPVSAPKARELSGDAAVNCVTNSLSPDMCSKWALRTIKPNPCERWLTPAYTPHGGKQFALFDDGRRPNDNKAAAKKAAKAAKGRRLAGSKGKWYKCYNPHQTISEQLPNGIKMNEWEWINAIALTKPTASSHEASYEPERVLQR